MGKITFYPPGTPLPEDHPFKNPQIIFGMRPPESYLKRLREKNESLQKEKSSLEGTSSGNPQEEKSKSENAEPGASEKQT